MNTGPGRLRTLLDAFSARFPFDPAVHPSDETVLVRSPGRVNLIGEHTDYNDGFVMPLAIDREILIVGRRRRDDGVRLYSLDMDGEAAFRLADVASPADRPERRSSQAGQNGRAAGIGPSQVEGWGRYAAGVAWALREEGFDAGGFDAALVSSIPAGAGLSSSAALEVGVAVLLKELFGLALDPTRIAVLCRRAENEYVGVQCGIMDQFAVALGQQGHALLLDCRTLEYRPVPLPTQHVRLVVADTGVRRALASSEYNLRRRQCEEGVALLGRHLPGIRALRDVAPHEFVRLRDDLPAVIARQCGHVIYEDTRVLAAADALSEDNFTACGRLMNASHASLRDEYEVSCPELDVMVEIASTVPGVYGARMTGAGFGGCVVSLVRSDAVQALAAAIEAQYPERTGKTPAVHVVAPTEGASRLL